MDENNIVQIEAGKLQPSQFYINKDSLEILRSKKNGMDIKMKGEFLWKYGMY